MKGTSFLGLLTVLFVGLKLTGYIGWSWWWVLGPIWIPPTAVVVIVITLACLATLLPCNKLKSWVIDF